MSEDQPPQSEMILYQTSDGQTRVQCRFENETLWLTQKLIADVFQKDVRTINEHIQNVIAENELVSESVIRKFRITAADGKTYETQHYSLEMILAIGYRVRSHRGTQFRQWATARLSEYLIKGFTMDDERLKNPPGPGVPDYFDELLERIRDIRASERRMYLRVRDIMALAGDYTEIDAQQSKLVFQTVQNKLHFAVTGQTAPELIARRANAAEPHMGLTSWKGDLVRKGDVTIAKNYLREAEIAELNRIVVMFLDYAEDQAQRRKQVFLNQWPVKLDEFLEFNERRVLPGLGSVSRESADGHANREFDRFNERRRLAIEDQAEQAAIRELEETAKRSPVKPPKPKKPRKPNVDPTEGTS